MPSRQQLEAALINADKAGDVQAATMLATALKNNQFDSATEAPNQDAVAGMLRDTGGLSAPQLKDLGAYERTKHVIADLPRGAGVAARSTLEGLGGVADFITTPVRAIYQGITGTDTSGMGKGFSDFLGLPKPEPGLESVVAEGQKMVAGGGGLLGLAGKGSQLVQAGGTAQKITSVIAARPDLQLASSVGSGLAGGYAKESGGGPLEQALASLAGGLAAPLGVASTQSSIQGVKNLIAQSSKNPEFQVKIDVVLEAALREKGLSLGDIASNVRSQLKNDMQDMLKSGEVSPAITRRLIDYRTAGLTPTAGPLTLDPGIITKQKNLSKIGANSQDPSLQNLSQIENQNARKLTEGLNELGAGSPNTTVNAGQQIIGALDGRAAWAKREINALYQQARDSGGRSAKLEPSFFAKRANDALDESLLGSKLPADVRNNLNKIAKGEIPLTVDVAEQFKTSIGILQRATADKAERMALGLVRKALDETPLQSGQGIGRESIDAFNKARAVNYKWMRRVEQSPALQAVVDGVEPDKFMQSFIIGTGKDASLNNVVRLRSLVRDNPEAMTAIKNNIAQFLKQKALSGASDEVGKFSGTGYNKAIAGITDAKLALFFTKREMAALKALGRVASYEQTQPIGSAVNNSNTAASVIATVLDKIGNNVLLRKIPFGAEVVGNPIKNITASVEAKNILKIPATKAMTAKQQFIPLPAILAPYLDSGEQPRDDN